MRIGFIGAGKVGFTLGNILPSTDLMLQDITAAIINRLRKPLHLPVQKRLIQLHGWQAYAILFFDRY